MERTTPPRLPTTHLPSLSSLPSAHRLLPTPLPLPPASSTVGRYPGLCDRLVALAAPHWLLYKANWGPGQALRSAYFITFQVGRQQRAAEVAVVVCEVCVCACV
jgi:hypothetical protein